MRPAILPKKNIWSERPKTLEIGDKCPGRIGEWLGWEIVKKYAEGQNVPLHTLMENPDAQRIFMQSKYKPQVTLGRSTYSSPIVLNNF